MVFKTNVTLSHVKFMDEGARADHEGGWGNILDELNNVMVHALEIA